SSMAPWLARPWVNDAVPPWMRIVAPDWFVTAALTWNPEILLTYSTWSVPLFVTGMLNVALNRFSVRPAGWTYVGARLSFPPDCAPPPGVWGVLPPGFSVEMPEPPAPSDSVPPLTWTVRFVFRVWTDALAEMKTVLGSPTLGALMVASSPGPG